MVWPPEKNARGKHTPSQGASIRHYTLHGRKKSSHACYDVLCICLVFCPDKRPLDTYGPWEGVSGWAAYSRERWMIASRWSLLPFNILRHTGLPFNPGRWLTWQGYCRSFIHSKRAVTRCIQPYASSFPHQVIRSTTVWHHSPYYRTPRDASISRSCAESCRLSSPSHG